MNLFSFCEPFRVQHLFKMNRWITSSLMSTSPDVGARKTQLDIWHDLVRRIRCWRGAGFKLFLLHDKLCFSEIYLPVKEHKSLFGSGGLETISTPKCQPQKKGYDSGTVDLPHAFVFSFEICCPREPTSLKIISMGLAWCCPCPCLYCDIPTMSHLQGFQGAAPVPTSCTCCFVHCCENMWSRSLSF